MISGAMATRGYSPEDSGLEQYLAGYRWMLELKDNWDGEGASPIDQETLARATTFTRSAMYGAFDQQHAPGDLPRLSPGPEGSIDIHWEYADHELAANIPADRRDKATFYFRNDDGARVTGEAPPSAIASLVSCLLHR